MKLLGAFSDLILKLVLCEVIMMIRSVSMIIVCIGLIIACSGVSVSTDYDKEQAFSSLKSYQWHDPPFAMDSKDARMVSSIMAVRIKSAIDKQLNFKGFKKQSTNVDFFVNYGVLTQDKVDFDSYNTYSGYGPGWGWHGGYGYGRINLGVSTQTMKTYQKGTLVIDIIDAKSNKLIWRGLGSKKLPSTSDAQKMDELIDLIALNILAHFPPK